MNARHNGKSENTPSRMWKWEWRRRRGSSGSTYNTVNSQMSNWGDGKGQAKLVAEWRGEGVQWWLYGKQRTKSDSGLSTARVWAMFAGR